MPAGREGRITGIASTKGLHPSYRLTFGAHWSEPRFQRRSVELLEAQRPPVIIQQLPTEEFEAIFPILTEYVRQHYRVADETDFEDAGRRYRVLRRADLGSVWDAP